MESFLDKNLLPISQKLSGNKYLQAVTKGMIKTLPLTISGAIFVLLAMLPFEAYTDFLARTGIQDILLSVAGATNNLIGFFAVFLIAYDLAILNEKDGVSGGLIALASYVILMPQSINIGKETVSALSYDYLGAGGLFVSILVALITGSAYNFIVNKGWTIRFPDSVPEMVSRSFQPIVATIIIFVAMCLINAAFQLSSFENIFVFIQEVVQTPILSIGGSLPGLIVIFTIINLFWFFGIHPSAILSVVQPILTTMQLENLAAYQAGQPLPHMGTDIQSLWSTGGTGGTLALCLFMAFMAKSERLKAIGKMSIIPAVFNINEPIVFGVPVVLNPTLFVPLVLSAPVTGTIAWVALKLGIVGYSKGITLPFTTPTFALAFINGGVSMLILSLIMFAVLCLLYYPFFKVLDKQYVEEEKSGNLN